MNEVERGGGQTRASHTPYSTAPSVEPGRRTFANDSAASGRQNSLTIPLWRGTLLYLFLCTAFLRRILPAKTSSTWLWRYSSEKIASNLKVIFPPKKASNLKVTFFPPEILNSTQAFFKQEAKPASQQCKLCSYNLISHNTYPIISLDRRR